MATNKLCNNSLNNPDSTEQHRVKSYQQRIEQLIDNRDYECALDFIYKSIQKFPNNSLLFYYYAHTCVLLQNNYEQYFRNPTCDKPNFNDYQTIEPIISQAINLEPENFDFYLEEINLMSLIGNTKNRRTLIKKYIRHFQNNPSALCRIIILITKFTESEILDLECEINYLERQITKYDSFLDDKTMLEIKLALATIRKQTYRIITILKKLIIIDSDNYAWWYQLGEIHLNLILKNPENGLQIQYYLERAEQLVYHHPNESEQQKVVNLLCQISVMNNKFDDNLSIFDKYISNKKDNRVWIISKINSIAKYITMNYHLLTVDKISELIECASETFKLTNLIFIDNHDKLLLSDQLLHTYWLILFDNSGPVWNIDWDWKQQGANISNVTNRNHRNYDKLWIQKVIDYALFIKSYGQPHPLFIDEIGFYNSFHRQCLIISYYLLGDFKTACSELDDFYNHGFSWNDGYLIWGDCYSQAYPEDLQNLALIWKNLITKLENQGHLSTSELSLLNNVKAKLRRMNK